MYKNKAVLNPTIPQTPAYRTAKVKKEKKRKINKAVNDIQITAPSVRKQKRTILNRPLYVPDLQNNLM